MAIHKELLKQGHEVRHYNLYHADGQLNAKTNLRHYSDEGLNKMLTDIKRKNFVPDVVFQLDYGQHHSPNLDKTHFDNAVWVLEAGDDPQNFRLNSAKANKFNLVLSPHLPCIKWYHNAKWWTQACDIDYLNEVENQPIQFDAVSTCGYRGNGLTEELKKELGDRFVYDRFYYNKDHTRRLKSGKMVFHCSQYKEIGRRIMEGMGCGKLVITDRLPQECGLDALFKDGEEIIYYDNAKDAIDKINYFASHNQEREEIALNGYKKVMENHTVPVRIKELLQHIEDTKL
jgi:hypothetical protein